MNTFLKAGLASTLALATATPALAQYQPSQAYQRDLQRYEQQRYAYQEGQQDYREARREYERRLQAWERERARYDRRYGSGAYARSYQRPVWNDGYYNQAPYAAGYGVNSSYGGACQSNNSSTITAGVIGALAGAALGSNVAARNARTEGAVLGAIVAGALGAGIGRANDRYKCDDRGPYYNLNETVAYRESAADRRRNSGRYNYSYYNSQRCRLAPAPVDAYGQDYRYVRVCPDNQGRYRITG